MQIDKYNINSDAMEQLLCYFIMEKLRTLNLFYKMINTDLLRAADNKLCDIKI